MSEELLINVTPQEIRVALVDNGVLQELQVERSGHRGLVGNIYKGVVRRVLPGMQAAFVDVGLDRTAFLHAADIQDDSEELNGETDIETRPGHHEVRNVCTLLHEGQEVLVQVIKDPVGSKGARLTTRITLPGRYLVYMPFVPRIGVSTRIESPEERSRLKDELKAAIPADEAGGYIIRTLAEGVEHQDFVGDIDFLRRLWSSIRRQLENSSAPCQIHSDLNLAMRMMRDVMSDNIERVRIDSRETYEAAASFCQRVIPEVADRMEHYSGERPLFDLYNVEDEIERALQSRVTLKSGAYLIIDQTEALTTVDVNTGGFVGRRNQEDTIFKTNLEAAAAIARQMRLRNIGGMIIIDFIDMDDEEHKRRVQRALEKAIQNDRTRCNITQISALGLVEMTRKRTRESLRQTLCEPCSYCHGRGFLKTAETICYEILREIVRESRAYPAERFVVLASPMVMEKLLDEESTSLAALEEFIGRPIKVQAEATYTQEQYDIILM
ncbi:ribonuclease G [Acidithiobacillus thiooxidans]|jgi:ribonuclease G|uniref:Ribonuclease G n=2 Tax=Acidithiobacillus thiooxidans TaxID=930 RepID=A0A543Q734_ACITH|nr:MULTISPECIES: ribonuclease G [Acidithiobacillus]MBE7566081.1 ribonuclease G [Acidithiobacillus sp. HP-11]MBU2741236.1 ribonuclease G [Acidithiobacillus albertensis]MBU2752965.1 ribonuclease G [Acidithiobacillus thiooxidans]MBU2793320.1 ribonuclease G [Acidithiobacillus thiooxidans]MBU2810787.1 ribonuclease G [Acidithiobacillus thiooxidans]